MRTQQDVENQKNSRRIKGIETNSYSPPLGYIRGFRMSLVENQITIGKGYAEIRGKTANITSSYVINWEDYIVPGATILKGMTYYLYLESGGKHLIDNLAPVYDEDALAWYHPTLWSYRSIGQFDYGLDGTYSNMLNGDPIEAPSLATNSVTSRSILSSDIETVLLKTSFLYIGYTGTGTIASPDEGDTVHYVTGSSDQYLEYTGGAWVNSNGIVIGLLGLLIGCGGLYHPGNPPTSTEYLPHINVRAFNFDNSYADQNGIDNWDSKTQVAFSSSIKKFGTYSLGNDSANADSWITATEDWTFGDTISFSFWYRLDSILGSSSGIIAQLYYNSTHTINIWYDKGDNVLRAHIYNDPYSTYLISSSLTLLQTWHHIGLVYKTDEIYFVVDDEILSTTDMPSWGAYTAKLKINFKDWNGAQAVFTGNVDDLQYNINITQDPNYIAQHYTHNVPWVTGISKLDILLRPGVDGRVYTEHEIKTTNVVRSTLGYLNALGEYGLSWRRVTNPPTGYMYTKTSGWTADTWVTVDVSAYVTAGTKAIKVIINVSTTSGKIFTRPYNDTNISSTPQASSEWSCIVARIADTYQEATIDLSSDYKFDIAVENVNSDVNISYPKSELRL